MLSYAPFALLLGIVGIILLFSWFRTVPQATVAVVTVFGKYQPHHARGAQLQVALGEGASSGCRCRTARCSSNSRPSRRIRRTSNSRRWCCMRWPAPKRRAIKKAVFSFATAAGVPAGAAADDRRVHPPVRRDHEAGGHPGDARGDRRAHQEQSRRGGARLGLCCARYPDHGHDLRQGDHRLDGAGGVVEEPAGGGLERRRGAVGQAHQGRGSGSGLQDHRRGSRQEGRRRCAAKAWRCSARTSPTA